MKYSKLPLTDDGELKQRISGFVCPRSMIIISAPKSGKTNAMVNVPRLLIGDTDPNGGTSYFNCNNVAMVSGTDVTYNKALDMHIPTELYKTVIELSKANGMVEYNKAYKTWENSPTEENVTILTKLVDSMPFPVFCVDTLTNLTTSLYAAALADVKKKFPKSTNIQSKTSIKNVDDYSGAQYTRETITRTMQFIEKFAAPFILYTGHIKDTKKVGQKDDDELAITDIDFEGQTIATKITSIASAVGICYRDDDGVWFDFVRSDTNKVSARPAHLSNRKIKISDIDEYEDGKLIKKGKTYWGDVYPGVLS